MIIKEMDYEGFFLNFQIDEMMERMNKAIEKKHTYHQVSVVSCLFTQKNDNKIIVPISVTYTRDTCKLLNMQEEDDDMKKNQTITKI